MTAKEINSYFMGVLNWLGHTIFVALLRISLLIDDTSDSSASRAALHSSSATGVLWATHVPKTSKKRTRSCGVVVILFFLIEFRSEYIELVSVEKGE
jgi:hypothetical protein